MGNVAEARRHLLRLAESQDASAALLRCVYAVFANLSSLDGDYSGAVQFAERGLALFPDDEHFLYAKAHAMYALQDYASAERALIRIIQAPAPRRMHFGETANIRHKLAPHLLAAICFMKGEYRQAEESYVALLRDFPDHAGTWYNLGLIFVATGERQKLEWVLRELRGCAAGKLDAQLLVARWRLARGELAAAGALIDQLIEQAPQSPYPRMIRVECLANCQSPLDAQVKAIRDVLRVDPANVQARAWMAQIERAQRAVTAAPAAAWSGTVAVGSGVAVG
jgi:tetratricopeptide (TPR) repeat protein